MVENNANPIYPDLSDSTLGLILAESYPANPLAEAALPHAEPDAPPGAAPAPAISLRGRVESKMDEKGRLSLPSEWRENLGQEVSRLYLVRRSPRHFFIFPQSQMAAIEGRLVREQMLHQLETVYLCSEGPSKCDAQGRIQISQRFREACGIGSEPLQLIGGGRKIRVCTLEALERYRQEVRERAATPGSKPRA